MYIFIVAYFATFCKYPPDALRLDVIRGSIIQSRQMGKINLLVANANQNFTDSELKIFESATKAAETFMVDHFDFDYEVDLFIVTPSFLMTTIPEDGITAQTYNSRLIIVTVDKTQAEINEDIIFETVCHEMSHSLRWEKLPEYSNTLFEGMILEGLAVALEEKAMTDTGRKTRQFFLSEMVSTPQEEIDLMIAHLQNELNSSDYDYRTVFFTGDDTLPRWTGYKLGYYFIKKHLEKTGQSIEQATLASYSKFSPEI